MTGLEKDNGCVIIGEPFITHHCSKKQTCVLIKCKCGKERITTLKNWKQNTGLCRKCKDREYVGEISGLYFSQIRYDAKKRNIDFKITKEYIWDLFLKQNRECRYTGYMLVFGDGNKEKNNVRTASLDRIDSRGCYEEGNVQWIHQTVNFMKQKLSEEEFFFWVELISEKRRRDLEISNETIYRK